ncbi:MAG: hypothetical protein U9N77_00590 [Thermodesulfobacteriota bacterium]|nr:hypothetical protein [Thermodesulfobacteriota bacterium]
MTIQKIKVRKGIKVLDNLSKSYPKNVISFVKNVKNESLIKILAAKWQH